MVADPTPDQSPPVDVNIDGQQPVDPQKSPEISSAPFDISLELTGDEDPENVKELIIAVRAGLEVDVGEGDDSGGGQRSDSEDNSDESLDSFLDD